MREKITFQTNVPVELALEAPGVFAEGQFGDQYRYFTTDGRIFWAPPTVEHQIAQLEIQPGELIIIVKSQGKEERRTVTKWVVKRALDSGTLPVQKIVQRAPEHGGEPARAAQSHQEMAQTQNISRKQRMADLLADAIAAVTEAASRTGRQLDGKEFQDLVSTLIIDQQRHDEMELRYFNARPSTMPNQPPRTNGHTNGATSWPQ